jgi:hypothetical protein
MTTNLRIGNLLAILILGGGAVACTSQAAPTTGTGGTGTGTGGTTGSGGSGTGGGGGSSSSTVACGTGSFAPSNGTVCPPPPSSGLITDFTYSADSGATDQVRFGDDATALSGGESTYANSGGTITSDVTQNDWHITAHVANYSGFNLYFDNVPVGGSPCNVVDASAFTGISFTIWGTSAGNAITMGMGIVDDTPTPSWFSSVDAGAVTTPGSCIPTSGSQYYHPGCADPTNAVTIASTATSAATAQTVSLKWTDLAGGACKPNVIPTQITSIYWQFLWSTTTTPYDVDIHIDNLTFTK